MIEQFKQNYSSMFRFNFLISKSVFDFLETIPNKSYIALLDKFFLLMEQLVDDLGSTESANYRMWIWKGIVNPVDGDKYIFSRFWLKKNDDTWLKLLVDFD